MPTTGRSATASPTQQRPIRATSTTIATATSSKRRGRLLLGPALCAAVLVFAGARFVTAGGGGGAVAPAGSLQQLQAEVDRNPGSAEALSRLAVAAATKHVETGDNGLLKRARSAAERAQAIDPDHAEVAFAMGLVLLSEHRFAEALQQGRIAVERAPFDERALGIVVDALVESGQYEEAVTTAQEMVDLGPGVASYSRISYIRELHGDPEGAARAMRQAETAANSPSDKLVVATYAGDLFRGAGLATDARRSYEAALGLSPGHIPAETGLARLDIDAGRLALAESRLEGLPEDQPDVATLLGDIRASQGNLTEAHRLYGLVRAAEDENRLAGLNVDVEQASFEAPRAGVPGGPSVDELVALAQRAVESRPTLLAHDALGWSLHKAGRSQEALEHVRAATGLGSRYASFWLHRAGVEHALGLEDDARAHLELARDIGAGIELPDRPEANRLGTALGVDWP